MSLFARSDLASVSVSAAHDGCGEVHVRPAPGGKPDLVWKLECSACENYLRSDPLWSVTLSEVPESPDETKTREDFEKRGTFDRDAVMAMAMAKLAGVDLPETLRRPLTGLPVHVPVVSGQVECGDGHPNEPGMKFCGECGTALRVPVKRACPDGHEVAAGMRFCGECGQSVADSRALEAAPEPAPVTVKRLKDMRAADLQAMARGKGLDDSGTRAEVLARLQAA
jgi:Double zinc ribbon